MLGDARAVAAADISVEDNQIIAGSAAAKEHPPILHLDLLFLGLLELEVVARRLHDQRIDFDGLNADAGIIMLESLLCAAAPEPDHQHARDLRVPEPWHMEIFGVLEVAFQRVPERHPRLPGVVKTEHAHAPLVNNAN